VGRECAENLALFDLGHLEDVERALQLGRDLVELVGRDPQIAVRLLQAEGRGSGLRRRVLEGSARDVGDPQRPHELQARQAQRLFDAPLTKLLVLGQLADHGVLDDRVAEVVDHGCDREDPAESIVKAGFLHGRSPSPRPMCGGVLIRCIISGHSLYTHGEHRVNAVRTWEPTATSWKAVRPSGTRLGQPEKRSRRQLLIGFPLISP